jgi:cell wall-associated NlpC family hydrolase
LRVGALGATLFSLITLVVVAVTATPALASGSRGRGVSGGTAVGGASISTSTSGGAAPAAPSTPSATTAPVHTAPVTARTSSIVYTGPVYEKTTTGAIVPYVAPAPANETNGATGGSSVELVADVKPELLVPGVTARYVDGLAAAPMSAPAAVQEIVWAGNQLIGLPYIYGGGHGSFISPGYDCSGTVSFALHGASLLSTPMDSSEFMVWGSHGVGQWVTVFSDPEHAYMTVAGLRLDTSAADDPSNEQGPRWRPLRQNNSGYARRHPLGL